MTAAGESDDRPGIASATRGVREGHRQGHGRPRRRLNNGCTWDSSATRAPRRKDVRPAGRNWPGLTGGGRGGRSRMDGGQDRNELDQAFGRELAAGPSERFPALPQRTRGGRCPTDLDASSPASCYECWTAARSGLGPRSARRRPGGRGAHGGGARGPKGCAARCDRWSGRVLPAVARSSGVRETRQGETIVVICDEVRRVSRRRARNWRQGWLGPRRTPVYLRSGAIGMLAGGQPGRAELEAGFAGTKSVPAAGAAGAGRGGPVYAAPIPRERARARLLTAAWSTTRPRCSPVRRASDGGAPACVFSATRWRMSSTANVLIARPWTPLGRRASPAPARSCGDIGGGSHGAVWPASGVIPCVVNVRRAPRAIRRTAQHCHVTLPPARSFLDAHAHSDGPRRPTRTTTESGRLSETYDYKDEGTNQVDTDDPALEGACSCTGQTSPPA